MVFLTVPFRAQSENLNNTRGRWSRASCWSTARCRSPPRSAARRRARSASGRGQPPSRPRKWSPTGSPLSPGCTRSPPLLADTGAELAEDVLLCRNRKSDKAQVAGLIEEIPGLRTVNAGPLEMARIVEQLTPLLISINAALRHAWGIRISGLPDADHWA